MKKASRYLDNIPESGILSGELAFKLLTDEVNLLASSAVLMYQGIDIKPVAHLGGNSAGRGVGLNKITHALQLCHLVAYGGRGAGKLGKLGEVARANRITVLNMSVHDSLKYLKLSWCHSFVRHTTFPSEQPRPHTNTVQHPRLCSILCILALFVGEC